MYKLYQYNDNFYRLVVTKNDNNISHETDKEHYYSSDYVETCSLSRSKRMIREYSLCNPFTYFFTSTVNSELCDRFSLTQTQEKIRQIIKSIKRKNASFIYLFITEKHKDGAFHFHGLCSDLELYVNDNGYFSSKDFDKLGFNSFSKIKNKTKVSNYITKYITKSCVRNEAGSVYFCSKGLKKADSYEIKPIDLKDAFGKRKHFENDYLKIYDFNIHDLNDKQKIYFMTNFIEKENFLKEIIDKCRNNLVERR